MSSQGGVPIQEYWCPHKKRHQEHAHIEERPYENMAKGNHLHSRKRVFSPETSQNLDFGLLVSKTMRKSFLWFKHLSVWCFAVAALTNEHKPLIEVTFIFHRIYWGLDRQSKWCRNITHDPLPLYEMNGGTGKTYASFYTRKPHDEYLLQLFSPGPGTQNYFVNKK